ncbi:hypothetical protein EJB05_03134 [Eragrostis curvula]|uniref:Cathepsin propeptide inhibitor domain-containing protein n=1 Tax=Eragrostis curvula TaxID=38414 RepID=A0A5J9WUE5_9POAL|nr:hypothetical protein EJB05_03134 [Eragrostis curvula]
MAGRRHHHRRSHLPVAVILVPAAGLLLLLLLAAVADDDRSSEEGGFKISVRYPSAEDSEWLDRWAAKYKNAPPGSGGAAEHGGFSVTPATDEESAYLNRIFANAKKAAAGYDGRIEFDDNDRPRIVVDATHSPAGSSKVDDEDL